MFENEIEKLAQQSQDIGKSIDAGDHRVALSEDDNGHRFLIYATDDGIEARLRYTGDKFWLPINEMATFFGRDPTGIMRHVNNVLDEGELPGEGNLQKLQLTPTGRPATLCSLDMVISVAYRVTNSKQATALRIWATDKLVQILTRGYYIDEGRLRNLEDDDVLAEFKETARRIRTSVQNSYREVKKLCTLCSDYDGSDQSAREFFMDMENKLLWAAAQKTAPQLILERCRAARPNLGLTYFNGKRGPTQRDVIVGNNYLAEGEARTKNRITEMWLSYVEEQLDQGRLPTMEAVREKMVGFIKFNQWPVLVGKGSHSRTSADRHALEQLETYRQRIEE
jgi:hypothetical protein